ncbi:MAG: hypothetical protein AAF065_03100 [Verrucomicrobiota bacterium]
MDKIRALLLPLALVFAAIAIFEFGARYGASNTRALAVAGQLQNFLNIYVQALPQMDEQSKFNLGVIIDNHIATAAIERNAWYLKFKDEPKASLEKVLAAALAVRGDDVLSHLDKSEAKNNVPQLNPTRLAEVREAIEKAKTELVKSTPEQPQVIADDSI